MNAEKLTQKYLNHIFCLSQIIGILGDIMMDMKYPNQEKDIVLANRVLCEYQEEMGSIEQYLPIFRVHSNLN